MCDVDHFGRRGEMLGFVDREGGVVALPVGLICGGFYVLYEELFVRYSGIHGRYQPFGVGLILIGSGVVWLWFYVVGDFVLKRLSGKE